MAYPEPLVTISLKEYQDLKSNPDTVEKERNVYKTVIESILKSVSYRSDISLPTAQAIIEILRENKIVFRGQSNTGRTSFQIEYKDV